MDDDTKLAAGATQEDCSLYSSSSSTYAHFDFLEFKNEYWIHDEEQAPAFFPFPPPSGGSSSLYRPDLTSNKGGSSSSTAIAAKKEIRDKVAFKTRSEVEILDDGFKWRKYGKKMVKNSPNPRNYYKCSVEGCSVKKRVERDNKDPNFVVTTYEGIHNHQGQ